MNPIVVIPTYDERENIAGHIAAIFETDPSLNVVVVDDNSPDGTGELADRLALADPRVHVIHRPSKQGLGPAYRDGFRFALNSGYSHVIEMDADGSHRPADLLCLLAAADQLDVVIGSRNVAGGRAENWSWLRHVISKGGSLYTRLLLGLPVKDCTSGFKCFNAAVLASIPLDEVSANGYGFQIEMNWLAKRLGFRIGEVPIVFPNRTRGASKMSARIVFEALLLVLRLRLGKRKQAMTRRQPLNPVSVGLNPKH
jgi:dolichol-phosphate mannosyltransferase